MEVEEQSQALVSKFEIGQKLTAMTGRDYFDGLNLNDDLVIYNQIGEESCMNVDLFVDNRNSLLPTNMKPSLFQFPGQSGFVYRL